MNPFQQLVIKSLYLIILMLARLSAREGNWKSGANLLDDAINQLGVDKIMDDLRQGFNNNQG